MCWQQHTRGTIAVPIQTRCFKMQQQHACAAFTYTPLLGLNANNKASGMHTLLFCTASTYLDHTRCRCDLHTSALPLASNSLPQNLAKVQLQAPGTACCRVPQSGSLSVLTQADLPSVCKPPATKAQPTGQPSLLLSCLSALRHQRTCRTRSCLQRWGC